jgi:hypothetical protein
MGAPMSSDFGTQPDLFDEQRPNQYPGWKPHPDSASAYEAEATLLREGKLRPGQSVVVAMFPERFRAKGPLAR